MAIAEFKDKSKEELQVTLEKLLREQFKLRLFHRNGELTDTSKLKKVRRNIARVLTLISGKV